MVAWAKEHPQSSIRDAHEAVSVAGHPYEFDAPPPALDSPDPFDAVSAHAHWLAYMAPTADVRIEQLQAQIRQRNGNGVAVIDLEEPPSRACDDMGEQPVTTQQTPAASNNGTRNILQICATERQEVTWLADGLFLLPGQSILTARSKRGKSTLARNLLAAVADGSPFLSRKTIQGRVIYIAPDEPESVMQEHFIELAPENGANIFVWERVNPLPRGPAALATAIKNVGAILCVIDTLQTFSGVAKIQDYSEVVNIIAPYRDAAAAAGATILWLHHNNRGDSFLGSEGVLSIADTMMTYRRDQDVGSIETIQRLGINMGKTTVTFNAGRFTVGGNYWQLLNESHAKKVEQFIRESPGSSMEDITEGVSQSFSILPRNVRAAFAHLRKMKRVVCNHKGTKGFPALWKLADDETPFADDGFFEAKTKQSTLFVPLGEVEGGS